MIPIRDDAPRSVTPFVTYFLVAMNVLVFFFELSLTPQVRNSFLYQFGMVPSLVSDALHGVNGVPLNAAFLPILTSMFLHASWLHLIANLWVLLIFGDNIEGYLGHFEFLVLYLASGISAGILHILFNQGSQIPTVGASGAIAGVMGAYFLLFPSARVLTIVPFVFMFVWLPAWVVLGYWFLAQFLSGAATSIERANTSVGGVAFWAHVGGFLAGITLVKLFPTKSKRYSF